MSVLKFSARAALVAVAMLAASAQAARAGDKMVLTCTASTTSMQSVLTLDMAQKTVDMHNFSHYLNRDGELLDTGSFPLGTITSVTEQEILMTFPRTDSGPRDFVLNRYTLSYGPTSAPLYMSCQKQQKQL